MNGLRLRYIEVFQVLMQTRSMQDAAEILHTTQPSISKTLAALERQLGFALFQRTSAGLKPTADAETLLVEARRISDDVHQFQRLAAALQEGRSAQLRVHATPALANGLLPRAVAHYKRQWHDTALQLSVARTEVVVRQVRNQLTDLGLVITSAAEQVPLVRPLHSAALVCILPAGHRLAALAQIGPADLAGEELIGYRSSLGLGKLVDQAFADAGVALRVATRVNYSNLICGIVHEGHGVSVVDSLSLAFGHYPGLLVRPFMPHCAMQVGLVVSEQRPLSLQAERFVATLQDCLAALNPPAR
jgi:DNA-binding transcriptional LysR family regulator